MDHSVNCTLSAIDINSITQALMNGTGPQLYVNLTNTPANFQKETTSKRAPTYKTFSQKRISNHANASAPYSHKQTQNYSQSHPRQIQDCSNQVHPNSSPKNKLTGSNRNISILKKISTTSLIKIQFNSDTRLQHILKEILCLTREADVVSDLMINNDIADMKKQHNLFLDPEDDSLSISSSGSDSELNEELPEEMQFFGTGGMEESSADFENPLTDSDSEKTETADEGSSESTQETELKVRNWAPGNVQNNDSAGVQFKLEPDELIIEEKAFDVDLQNGQRKLREVPERISTYIDNNKITDIKTEKDEDVSTVPRNHYNDHEEDIKVNFAASCKDVHWSAHQTPQQPLSLTNVGTEKNTESELSESSEEHPFADSSSDHILSDPDTPGPRCSIKNFFLAETMNEKRTTSAKDKQGPEKKKD
ncbi:uncharacterized protein [Euwallacea similis]|uniref:uncharacterized protein isoform X2 n=1 Tax=Euwallacea similis TaxID=1736056 RepID=UPI0034504C2F